MFGCSECCIILLIVERRVLVFVSGSRSGAVCGGMQWDRRGAPGGQGCEPERRIHPHKGGFLSRLCLKIYCQKCVTFTTFTMCLQRFACHVHVWNEIELP